MSFHIVLSKPLDFVEWENMSNRNECPRHAAIDIAHRLGAVVHFPMPGRAHLRDRIAAALLIGQSQHWELARSIVKLLKDDDVVYCNSEGVGFPLAILSRFHGKKSKLVISVMAPSRPRSRFLLSCFVWRGMDERLLIDSPGVKSDFLRRVLRVPDDKIVPYFVPTDERFFSPGRTSIAKARPVIGSGGLEQRDYVTLAAATQDLNLDVVISAVTNGSGIFGTARALPQPMPSNMTARAHDWPELVELYRNSDIVVIPLFNHQYSAGVSTLLEAMACRRPVIITRTPGFVENMIDQNVVVGVQPGDAVGLRAAITAILNDPKYYEAMAHRAYEFVRNYHSHQQYVDGTVKCLRQLALDPHISSAVI